MVDLNPDGRLPHWGCDILVSWHEGVRNDQYQVNFDGDTHCAAGDSFSFYVDKDGEQFEFEVTE